MRPLVLLSTLLAAGTAQAARPTPDRPSLAAAGGLIAPDSLELEVGGMWAGSFSVPALLKYNLGGVEPRVGVDLAGIGRGAPGLTGQAKVAMIESPRTAASLYFVSAIPVGSGEAWWGTARVLVDAGTDAPVTASINAGADFVGDGSGGLAFAGVPVIVDLSGRLFGSVSGYGEVGGRVHDEIGGVFVDAGLGWVVTDILVLDCGAGWDFAADRPFLMLGGTVNVGGVGG